MPIIDATACLHKEAAIIHLGFGDVVIGIGDTGEEGCLPELLFLPQPEQNPIGNWKPGTPNDTTANYPGCIRIMFDNPESLDVLIERATHLREKINALSPQQVTDVPIVAPLP